MQGRQTVHDSPYKFVIIMLFVNTDSSTNHRYIPTLSTCAVARKSPVGENEILVATLVVRNTSIKRPVGMSNVLMIESRDDVINHLESEENA
jgi:hypothetical protein